jgi:hypothetical protein
MCIDAGSGSREGRIWTEYQQQRLLESQHDEGAVLRAMLVADRVREVAPVDIPFGSLRQALYDRTDHVLYRVAAAIDDRLLVSHDSVFWPTDRPAKNALRSLQRRHRVIIEEARDAAARLVVP